GRSRGRGRGNGGGEVMRLLDARGLFPLKIEEARGGVTARASGKRVKPKYMAVVYSQLADLLRAGVPLLRSLEILERQSSVPALSATLREVRLKVADGTRLAHAMMLFPPAFHHPP